MTEVCPVSVKQINERIARSNAILTFMFTLVFLLTPAKWIIYILAVDFIMRAFIDSSYSPFSILGRFIVTRINIEPKLINAGPKVFAARIGLFLTAATIVLYLTGFTMTGYIAAGILTFFTFLEGILGICVACKIYPFLFKERS